MTHNVFKESDWTRKAGRFDSRVLTEPEVSLTPERDEQLLQAGFVPVRPRIAEV